MAQMQRPASAEHLEALLRFVSELAKEYGFPPDRVRDIELAVEESLVNIVAYAYPQHTGEVDVRGEPDGRNLVFTILDHGIAFDPMSVSVSAASEDPARQSLGGVGVRLIRRLADHLAYRREGGANVLTLTFAGPPRIDAGLPVHPRREDNMITKVQRVEDSTLLAIGGRIDHKTAKAFEDVLRDTLNEGAPLLVLDLGGLEYMTSAGLRVLMIAAKSCANQQRKLAVADLKPAIHEIFKISRFDLVIPIYATVADALQELSPDAAAHWRK
jgi:anti-anti-sigma factor